MDVKCFPIFLLLVCVHSSRNVLATSVVLVPEKMVDVGTPIVADVAKETSKVAQNMQRREQAFQREPAYSFPILVGLKRKEKDNLLQVLGAIDHVILKGLKVPWDAFPPALPYTSPSGEQKPSSYEDWFKRLKISMQYMFAHDSCAIYWNAAEEAWFTCCEGSPEFPLGESSKNISDGAYEDMLFCGSNIAMEIPAPCRAAEKDFDYGMGKLIQLDGKADGGPQQIPAAYLTKGNTGKFSCPNATELTQSSGKAVTAGSEIQSPSRMSTASGFEGGKVLVRQQEDGLFVITLESPDITETFEIGIDTPTRTGGNLCGNKRDPSARLPSCVLLCCDSVYAASGFCTSSFDCF